MITPAKEPIPNATEFATTAEQLIKDLGLLRSGSITINGKCVSVKSMIDAVIARTPDGVDLVTYEYQVQRYRKRREHSAA